MNWNGVNENPCTARDSHYCIDCELRQRLMCRYDQRDTLHFAVIFLPFLISSIAGVLKAGFRYALFGWLVYMLVFFFVWEARVICRHCPFWAQEGRILRCHANYGVIKLWKYHPSQISRSEKAQFITGGLILIVFPMVWMAVGGEFLVLTVTCILAAGWILLLRRGHCSRCVNFSCPLNTVSLRLRDCYNVRSSAVHDAKW